MEPYYEELTQRIESLIEEKKYSLAMALVEQELQMPYIPLEVEAYLKKCHKDLIFLLQDENSEKQLSVDRLIQMLHGRPEQQMLAVEAFSSRNLRQEVEPIQEWLQNEPYPEAAALMIEALAEQEVGEEFTLCKDGVEYTFWPDDVVPVAKCEGFQKANHYLQEWLQTDNPDLYEMAKVLLVHEVYLFLPLTYDAEEGYGLAVQCVQALSELMDRHDLMELIEKPVYRQSLS